MYWCACGNWHIKKSITMEPKDTVTWLLISLSPASSKGFTAFVLDAWFTKVLAPFWDLLLSTVSFFLWHIYFAGVIGCLAAMRGRDNTLHSHNRSFPGYWAVQAHQVFLGRGKFSCVVHNKIFVISWDTYCKHADRNDVLMVLILLGNWDGWNSKKCICNDIFHPL